jgi:hypothetical protein
MMGVKLVAPCVLCLPCSRLQTARSTGHGSYSCTQGVLLCIDALPTACRSCPLQGLPATVTSLLSLTALRLKDRKVLIKRTGKYT